MSKWRTSIVLVVAGMTAAACSAGSPAPAPPSAPSVGTAIVPTKATAQLFVAPSGSDDNSGTQAAPLQSIQGAAKMAKPGTEVVVADGTYNGAITTDVNGTADARITFQAAHRGAAKIVGDGDADAAWENDGDYVDIDGFDITGSNTDGLLSGGSFVRLVNNNVHDFHDGNCITTANDNYDLHDIDVMGNIAARCGASELDHGIYVSHPNGVVANNISFGNAGFGIQCWHACNSLAISNNLVFGNAAGRDRDRAGRWPEQRRGQRRQLRGLEQHRAGQRPRRHPGERRDRAQQPVHQQHPVEQRHEADQPEVGQPVRHQDGGSGLRRTSS